VAGSTLLVSAVAPVVAHWHGLRSKSTALDQANSPGTSGANTGQGAAVQSQADQAVAPTGNPLSQWSQVPVARLNAGRAASARHAATTPRRAEAKRPAPEQSPSPQPKATASSAYRNPLRSVGDLVMERVDQGVDFGGAGPVYALGDAVITSATADSSGWPGGGWITYRLTDGPDAGLTVYLAEDVTPTVQVGQTVTSSTVIANMFNGGDGIETGWATSDGSTAESQMPQAGGISGGGPFPTMVGLSFEAVLESLGVPAAPNASEPGNGLLPSGYPAV
jgi:murein DD-endopeptidase MepM/ murein hydrolase activator NlpD